MSRPLSKAARKFADRAQRPSRLTDDDLNRLRSGLSERSREVAVALLGEPNHKMSSKHELRFGRKGSLAVKIAGERAGLWVSHGDKEGGDLIDLIERERGCGFTEAAAIAADLIGDEKHTPIGGSSCRQEKRNILPPAGNASDRSDNFVIGHKIFEQGISPQGTPVEKYLAADRHLILPSDLADVRFHSSCPDGPDRVPAIVAAIRDIHSDEIVGLHRTYLDAEAHKIGRKMLGRAKDAAIKLSPNAAVERGLFVGEGVETCIALLNFGFRPVWALGSAGNLRAFPVLAGVECLTIAVDHDATGESAAEECGQRWHGAGREVRFIQSPVEGEDIADLAARRA